MNEFSSQHEGLQQYIIIIITLYIIYTLSSCHAMECREPYNSVIPTAEYLCKGSTRNR